MARYKVSYDKSLCIGAFACVAACPKHFAQAGDKADLIGADNAKDLQEKEIGEEDLETCKDAEGVCPVNCIKVVETK
ncbi:MAG TPA: ferredoxin [Candidatus Diapherotrites archaeon]|uniref:Ferredoxin n=1 Tax=Candidatus Iainarchaeum sp. TaxID=3101447 RepID=A0A7J4JHP0_9ARCH|nr:ferredoxin [Candidatus Diapherotrites archaeon]HIH15915.1 ferredoxin [Candidatus Diapherotrites archaeon]